MQADFQEADFAELVRAYPQLMADRVHRLRARFLGRRVPPQPLDFFREEQRRSWPVVALSHVADMLPW